jgi:hypothetical protein
MMSGSHSALRSRARPLLASAIAVSASVLMTLGALLASALTCDESCDEASGRWQDSPDAWQWDAQLAIAVLGLCGALALAVAVIARRRRLARAGLAASVSSMLAWSALLGFLMLSVPICGLVALLAAGALRGDGRCPEAAQF